MGMDLPKFHETFIPILEILSSGETLHRKELYKLVFNKYFSHLPEDLLNRKTEKGGLVIFNPIGWGMSSLKVAKFVEQPERALVKITEKGKNILGKGTLTLKDLRKDTDYIAYQESKQKKGTAVEEINLESASPQDLIDTGFSIIETQVKNELLEKLKEIDPYYFEKVILILLKKMGYGDLIETRKSSDGGIDGIINEDKLGLEKIYTQAKRYNENKIREKEIRNFIGAMSGDTNKGVFITTSTFDDSAVKKAREAHHKIILIDGIKLVDLMHQYGVGIQVRNIYEAKEIDETFFEDNEF